MYTTKQSGDSRMTVRVLDLQGSDYHLSKAFYSTTYGPVVPKLREYEKEIDHQYAPYTIPIAALSNNVILGAIQVVIKQGHTTQLPIEAARVTKILNKDDCHKFHDLCIEKPFLAAEIPRPSTVSEIYRFVVDPFVIGKLRGSVIINLFQKAKEEAYRMNFAFAYATCRFDPSLRKLYNKWGFREMAHVRYECSKTDWVALARAA